MSTTSSDTKKEMLRAAFKAVAEASDTKKNDFGDDGGSCNFDTATILPQRGDRLATYQAAAAGTGVRLEEIKWMGSRAWWVFAEHFAGMGNRRTRQAEAMQKVLKEHGINATVYYRMD